nr:immunoglobulin light chain junction region [Macaca mulatta]MOX86096.1 immunoglobulin light chain junction region [Macaca mulatta]MOX86108.1 immunoglobulin light chain junction region [Macaca mulatta]MOX86661.1 immunoglobulin light chain junction region [Macaca mulatta]MOX87378.1 immunoglobulin light chain junction region [Macaca mulatta]
CMQGLEIPPTF